MEKDCVDLFYKSLEIKKDSKIFHYNVTIVNDIGDIIKNAKIQKEDYPLYLDAQRFFYFLMKYKINCFAVEFIFNKKHFFRKGGFVDFDLAWGSDVATWTTLALESGIHTINGGRVFWRQSSQNITPNKSILVQKRKHYATIEFINYLNQLLNNKFCVKIMTQMRFLHQISESSDILSTEEIKESIDFYLNKNKQYFFHYILKALLPMIFLMIKIKKSLIK
jgi:hypothetical protein